MTEKLIQGIEKLGLNFSGEQMNALETYIEKVLEFNQSYNLMKADSPDELAVNHILDSLAAVPHISQLIENICSEKNITHSLEGKILYVVELLSKNNSSSSISG